MRLVLGTQLRSLLRGSLDMHVHPAPDVYDRIVSDLELARQAQEVGMRGVVIKNHFGSTAERAWLATDETGFPVYGAIALNHTVGGLNLHAVDFASKMGARVVWLPTLHAENFLEKRAHVQSVSRALGDELEGIRLVDEQGHLVPALYPILDLIAQRDVILATGHVSVSEARAVVREAAARGVKKIVITHPLASFIGYTVTDLKEMLDLGATYIEHVYNDTTRHVGRPIPAGAIYDAIKAIGTEHCILATDSGQWLNPVPVHQFAIYMQEMLSLGLSEQEIRTMTADNPVRVLGI